jgi:GTP pyrophosphokinase
MKTLPAGATALDFAYEIHTHVGHECIGAKINNRLVPLSHILKSGDQVEVLVSEKQKPKTEWLGIVVTARAKTKIKEFLRDERKDQEGDGKVILMKRLKSLKVKPNETLLQRIAQYFRVSFTADLYQRIAINAIDLKPLKEMVIQETDGSFSLAFPKLEGRSLEQLVSDVRGKSSMLVLDEKLDSLDYQLSSCCNPIKGDDVFGFLSDGTRIQIHRTNCPNAIQLMSNFGYRIVKAKWTGSERISFLAGIKVTGTDEVGIVNNITSIISSEYNVNMRSISFDTNEGLFDGTIMVYVHDTNHLTGLIKKLKQVSGVMKVFRIDSKQEQI